MQLLRMDNLMEHHITALGREAGTVYINKLSHLIAEKFRSNGGEMPSDRSLNFAILSANIFIRAAYKNEFPELDLDRVMPLARDIIKKNHGIEWI